MCKCRVAQLIALILVCLGASGCFGVRQLDVRVGLSEYQLATPEAVASTGSANGSIAVDVVSSPGLGCYLRSVDEGSPEAADAFLACELVAVSDDGFTEELQALADRDARNLGSGVLFGGIGEVLRDTLKAHLDETGAAASVRLVPATADNTAVTPSMTYYQAFWRTGMKRSVVTLQATPSGGGSPVSATADINAEMGNGHLAWMIPLGVLTFPIGLAIGSIIFDGMESGLMERVTAEAVDRAAAELATKLVAVPAVAGRQSSWSVSLALR